MATVYIIKPFRLTSINQLILIKKRMPLIKLIIFLTLLSLGGMPQGIALMMEAARTSETLVNFYQITRCYNPEDSNLHERLTFARTQHHTVA
jgi:hypothetical protein